MEDLLSPSSTARSEPEAPATVVTVVLADDSSVYRRAMRRAIEADARLALVAEVGDGAAALAAIRELQPDVALLDLQMPVLDGVEVGCRLRADPPPRRPRLVLVTALLSDEIAERARACGMDHQRSPRRHRGARSATCWPVARRAHRPRPRRSDDRDPRGRQPAPGAAAASA